MTPTQVQHPWRTTARTVVWIIIGVLVSIPTIWPIVLEESAKVGLAIPDSVKAAIAYAVTVIVVIIAIVQRVVLLPRVAAIIAKIPGLSPGWTEPVQYVTGPETIVQPVVPEFVVQDENGVITTHYSAQSTTTDPGIGNPPTSALS